MLLVIGVIGKRCSEIHDELKYLSTIYLFYFKTFFFNRDNCHHALNTNISHLYVKCSLGYIYFGSTSDKGNCSSTLCADIKRIIIIG